MQLSVGNLKGGLRCVMLEIGYDSEIKGVILGLRVSCPGYGWRRSVSLQAGWKDRRKAAPAAAPAAAAASAAAPADCSLPSDCFTTP